MIRETLSSWLPKRFLTSRGFRYLYSFALVADATIEAALQGMAARLPGFGTPTALPRIGRDRGIKRGFAESDAHYATRLINFLAAQKKRGSAFELMRQVQGYLSPASPAIRWVITKANLGVSVWRTLYADGTTSTQITSPVNFNWDGRDATLATRAWLIIYSTSPNNVWDQDGTWDDTATLTWDEDAAIGTWGSTATLEQIQGVRDIIRDWKGAQTLYSEILICFDDAAFDPGTSSPPNPDGLWRYYHKVDAGVAVMARNEDTVYWIGP